MKISRAGAFLASVLVHASLASANAIVAIEPATTSVSPGAAFSVDVNITGVADLYAFQFDLQFDPSTISAVDSLEGTLLPGGGSTIFVPGLIDNVAGVLSSTADSLIGPVPGVNGNGRLATIDLTALTQGVSSLTLSNVVLLDSNLGDIPVSVASADVNVAPAIPEPDGAWLFFAGTLVIGLCLRRNPQAVKRS